MHEGARGVGARLRFSQRHAKEGVEILSRVCEGARGLIGG